MTKILRKIKYGLRRRISLIKDHLLKKHLRELYGKEKIQVLVLPKIKDIGELEFQLQKIHWVLPDSSKFQIIVKVGSCIHNDGKKVIKRTGLINQNVIIYGQSPVKVKPDLILDFNYNIKKLFKPSSFHKSVILDPNFYSTVEGNNQKTLYFKTLSPEEKDFFRKVSKKNYQDLEKLNELKKDAICFVSGPSFNKHRNFEINSSSLRVICNSIIKNTEFIEYIGGVDVVAFSDPVFHFSWNNYAKQFRQDLMRLFEKYQPYIVVPDSTVPLLLKHYPKLINRIIGFKTCEELKITNNLNLSVPTANNILTLLMIPLAISLQKQTYIIGADGRDPKENYFWKHNSSVQYDELMKEVFNTHTSFFRDRDYQKYYEEHCNHLERLLNFYESNGRKINSLTHSNIKSLKERFISS